METKTQLFVLIIVAVFFIAILATSRTSLLTGIDVDLSGIMPNWEQYWENFVAIQVNSSVQEVSVNLTFGKHKSEVCEQAIYLTDGNQSLVYNLSDKKHDEKKFCDSAVVKWKNKIYDETLKKPRMTVYYLYFGPVKQMPTTIPIVPIGGTPVSVYVESNETVKSYITDSQNNPIEANITFYSEEWANLTWSTDMNQSMPYGMFDVNMSIGDMYVELDDAIITNDTITLIKIDNLDLNSTGSENLTWTKLFSFSPMVDFIAGIIKTTATGEQLWKCINWSSGNCDNWTFIQNLTSEEIYNITITPTDPVFGETIQTNITNLTTPLGEPINVSGIIKTKITFSKYTYQDVSDDTLFLLMYPNNSNQEITVMAFPNKTYTYESSELKQNDIFNMIDLWGAHINYIEAEIVPIEPQLIPFEGHALYHSQEGFPMNRNSYTNNTYELVRIFNFALLK